MVATTSKKVRFGNNNQAAAISLGNITFSSELSNFPFVNCRHESRYKVYKPAGNFSITSSNNLLYINDGSNKTATIPVLNYIPSTLATAIETALNLVSSNWACTYSTLTRKFTVTNSGSVTLRETQTTDSAWGVLGFTAGTDHAGTSFEADESRNHTHESIIYDFGAPRAIDFFALIGLLGENMTISESATVTLKGSAVSNFTSPAVSIIPSRTESGFFHFEDVLDMSYRFWEIKFIDQFNTVGPEGFNITNIYLGDYDTFSKNISTGIAKTLKDLSKVKKSDAGASFFRKKSKYVTFKNLSMTRISRADRNSFEVFYNTVGVSESFYVSIDPALAISDEFDDFTKLVRFDADPVFTHALNDTFNVSFNLSEVI